MVARSAFVAEQETYRANRAPVTRERIGAAALRILDAATDESALTMRSLGAELGVRAPSLYAHVSGIDDVLGLVHARINATIDLSVLDDPDPREGLRRFAHGYRDAYRRHHVAATIIVTRSINDDHALAVYDAVADCLGRAGVADQRIMAAMALLDNVVLGSAIEPFAAGFVGSSASYRARYPALARGLRATRRRYIDDEGFELGIDAFFTLLPALSHSPASEAVAGDR